MNISFFQGDDGSFDARAVTAGVYRFDIGARGNEGRPSFCLYVGESVWMAERCATHLYALFDNPSYFGLSDEHLKNDNLSLVIRVAKGNLPERKDRHEWEKKIIEEEKPLAQLEYSDRLDSNRESKVKKAIEKLIENSSHL